MRPTSTFLPIWKWVRINSKYDLKWWNLWAPRQIQWNWWSNPKTEKMLDWLPSHFCTPPSQLPQSRWSQDGIQMNGRIYDASRVTFFMGTAAEAELKRMLQESHGEAPLHPLGRAGSWRTPKGRSNDDASQGRLGPCRSFWALQSVQGEEGPGDVNDLKLRTEREQVLIFAGRKMACDVGVAA